MLLLAGVLVITGCGGGRSTKPGRVRSVQQVAPSYDIRDDKPARKRMQYQELLRLSADRMGRGEFDEALKHARSAQKLEPSVADAYTVQAVIEARRGHGERAGELYRKAVEVAPGQADVVSNYGAWLCGNGHPAESLVWFDRVLQDAGYGGRAETLANAGGCALEAGQLERADRDLREALALRPDNPYALESMARSEFSHGRYFEARAFYQRRLAAAPATASVLQLAVQIENGLGDKVAASRYQQRLREEFPSAATSNPQG
ncbi:MAG: tetratricopeptide repeat protein [Stenotrophomonas sp.]